MARGGYTHTHTHTHTHKKMVVTIRRVVRRHVVRRRTPLIDVAFNGASAMATPVAQTHTHSSATQSIVSTL